LLQQLGRWNGLVKSILDGDADIAISALQITPDRADVIDFSVPFLETGISILVAVRDGVISPMAFLGIILQQFYLLFFSLFLFLLLSCLLQWAAADIMLSAACVSLCVRIRIPISHPTKSANRRSEPNVP